MELHVCNLGLKVEDRKFKVILGYIAISSLRPAWATGDPASKINKKTLLAVPQPRATPDTVSPLILVFYLMF